MLKDAERRMTEEIATKYAIETKGWKMGDFEVEVLDGETSPEPGTIVADLVHVEDLQGKIGGGKSVQLQIDLNSKKVVKELAFQ